MSGELADVHGIIDLFAGAGGFSWGWHRSGCRPLAAIELDTAAARTYELNFASHHTLVLNDDLTALSPAQLAGLLGKERLNLLAICGGPPCQGWSKVGRGKLRSLRSRASSLLSEPGNGLYRRFVDYVTYFKPSVFVMENVPGMLNIEGRNVAEEVRANFEDSGYATTYEIANARWFGVPQDRRRLIFIGVREDLELLIDVADLKDYAHWFRTELVGLPGETNLRQAIVDLPEIIHGTRRDPQPYQRRVGRQSAYAQLMRAGSNGLVTDHIVREHNAQDLCAFEQMPEGGLYHQLPSGLKRYREDIFKDKYKKLYWDRPAWTVTAHLAKDVYSHIHPAQPRTISIREAARIQSFPDDFKFFGNMGDRFRQIGNAVPPLMAWGIAEFIGESLGQKS